MIAHSYGSFLAIILSTYLESKGKKGYVTNIDGSPVGLNHLTRNELKNKTEAEFDNYILTYIASILDQNIDKSLFNFFANYQSWDEKLEKFLEIVSHQSLYTTDVFRSVMNALRNRIESMRYETEDLGYVLNTRCTLIKPTEEFMLLKSENLELDKYFKQEIDIIQLEGNHQSIIENPELVIKLNEIHSSIL